jgi:hypothetical protein
MVRAFDGIERLDKVMETLAESHIQLVEQQKRTDARIKELAAQSMPAFNIWYRPSAS